MSAIPATGNRTWRWRRASRRIVQLLTFTLFFYLLLVTAQLFAAVLPHDLFFRLDPLAGIAAMTAGRVWMLPLALGGVTIVLTLLLGRVWCTWACPMGTLLDWTRLRRTNRADAAPDSRGRYVKYGLLFTTLLAAIAGSLTLLVLDPVSLLVRTFATTLLPAINYAVTGIETALYDYAAWRAGLTAFDQAFRAYFPAEPRYYLANLAPALLFVGVLGLNALRPRFWCRYLCPLGALLALGARFAWIRRHVDTGACTDCGQCQRECRMAAIDGSASYGADAAECIVCLECREICPTGAISFRTRPSAEKGLIYSAARRRLVTSLGAAAAGAAVLGTVPRVVKADSGLVRPPGVDDARLRSLCFRCAECIKICPTSGLQPSQTAPGWDGLWTPTLVSRFGYCDYSCTSCGEVCPSGAIPELTLADKRREILGRAVIDEDTCIPFAEGRECIVCEEMCPVPQKAIVFDLDEVTRPDGVTVTVRLPRVIEDDCIGCGICEYQCPVNGPAAIVVKTDAGQAAA